MFLNAVLTKTMLIVRQIASKIALSESFAAAKSKYMTLRGKKNSILKLLIICLRNAPSLKIRCEQHQKRLPC